MTRSWPLTANGGIAIQRSVTPAAAGENHPRATAFARLSALKTGTGGCGRSSGARMAKALSTSAEILSRLSRRRARCSFHQALRQTMRTMLAVIIPRIIPAPLRRTPTPSALGVGLGDQSKAKLRYRITRPFAHHPVSFPRNPGAQYQKLSVAGVVSLLAGPRGFEPRPPDYFRRSLR